MRTAEPLMTATAADAVLNALPHPVIVVSADGKVTDANVAAEAFFELSALHLRRHLLHELVPFGSPLLALVDQVRESGAAPRDRRALPGAVPLDDLVLVPHDARPSRLACAKREARENA